MFNRVPHYRITRGTGIGAALGFMALGAALALLMKPAVVRIREARVAAPDQPIEDGVLVERVRAALARAVPGAEVVDVRAREGRVTLRGPARPDQIGEMVACAERVAGVRGVDNRLALSEA
jgi:hypothetical protein